jgi:chromosome segregation ATPase
MIKSLKIQNFQSHKLSTLDFAPGVNVIIGSSDSGKTAILRALRWLIWNRPIGEEFRSTWGGETVIHLETDTDVIDRWKHNYENAYRLNTQTDFKAFGTDVPEDIIKALNITEINLQGQLDAPFLLSNSPGEVAQHFNKIAKLDKIDAGIQNIQRSIRELGQTIEHSFNQIWNQEQELKQFDHLEKFEAEVEVLEDMGRKLINKRNALKELELTCGELQNTNDEIDEYTKILSLEKQVNTIDNNITLHGEKKVELLKLEHFISHIKRIKNDIDKGEELLKSYDAVNKVIWDIDQRDTFKLQLKTLRSDTQYLIAIQIGINETEDQVKTLQKQFDKEMGNVCPLCGQSIKK